MLSQRVRACESTFASPCCCRRWASFRLSADARRSIAPPTATRVVSACARCYSRHFQAWLLQLPLHQTTLCLRLRLPLRTNLPLWCSNRWACRAQVPCTTTASRRASPLRAPRRSSDCFVPSGGSRPMWTHRRWSRPTAAARRSATLWRLAHWLRRCVTLAAQLRRRIRAAPRTATQAWRLAGAKRAWGTRRWLPGTAA